MIVLGIESSCDETAASIVKDGYNVLSNVIYSQADLHAQYGGVIPEVAARLHLSKIKHTVQKAVQEASLNFSQIDGIAVTETPGLLPALLVGTSFSKGLANTLEIPLVGVNHIISHIYSSFLGDNFKVLADSNSFPILSLVVSGGHTLLVLIDEQFHCKIIGRTIDDAAGEAYDKAAKLLGLSYPGGPEIDKMAKLGNGKAVSFPRALTGRSGKNQNEHKFNFSFSGVKTSLFYHLKKSPLQNQQDLNDNAASFQEAVVDVLVEKAFLAVEEYDCKTITVSGGVACNSRLKERLQETAEIKNTKLLISEPKYCTDNAAMIAGLGFHLLSSNKNGKNLSIIPRFQYNDEHSFS